MRNRDIETNYIKHRAGPHGALNNAVYHWFRMQTSEFDSKSTTDDEYLHSTPELLSCRSYHHAIPSQTPSSATYTRLIATNDPPVASSQLC
jgi:hypothetical protein